MTELHLVIVVKRNEETKNLVFINRLIILSVLLKKGAWVYTKDKGNDGNFVILIYRVPERLGWGQGEGRRGKGGREIVANDSDINTY